MDQIWSGFTSLQHLIELRRCPRCLLKRNAEKPFARKKYVICATISSHPVAFRQIEKMPLGLKSTCLTVRPAKQLRYRSHQHLCCNGLPNYLKTSCRYPHYLLHALPLQAVTMDNDSEGSTSQGPAPSVEYAGAFSSDQGPRQSLLCCVQVWYTNTRKRGLSESIKHVLETSKTELKSLDKEVLCEKLKRGKLVSSLVCWWTGAQPWIKLPITIFVPWFLIVSFIYGTSVSMDLIPLWVIGPIIVGLSIKAGIQISAVCRRKIADMRLEEHVINLIEGVKSGELPRRCIQGSLSKYEEVKIVVFTKKSDVASFIQNGEIMPVLRRYYNKKLEELAETWSDKYQDARLFYLYVERKLKNII